MSEMEKKIGRLFWRWRKNWKNSILGINNVDPKPEPNVQKKIIFDRLSIS